MEFAHVKCKVDPNGNFHVMFGENPGFRQGSSGDPLIYEKWVLQLRNADWPIGYL